MKTPAFKIGTKVKTAHAAGVIIGTRSYDDHVEYLVEFTDQTAHYVHEDKLKAESAKTDRRSPTADN